MTSNSHKKTSCLFTETFPQQPHYVCTLYCVYLSHTIHIFPYWHLSLSPGKPNCSNKNRQFLQRCISKAQRFRKKHYASQVHPHSDPIYRYISIVFTDEPIDTHNNTLPCEYYSITLHFDHFQRNCATLSLFVLVLNIYVTTVTLKIA